MRKGKKAGRKHPAKHKDSSGEEGSEPQTQEKAELVPPAPSAPEPHRRPVLFRLLQDLRAAAGSVLDLADAAAEAITKTLRREA